MEKVKLGEIFEYLPKSKFKAGDGKERGKYKFFTSSNVQNKFIDEFIYDGEYLIFGTGGKASINYCNDKFSTSTDNFVVKVNKEINTKLIFLYFQNNMDKLEKGFKGASIKHISKEYINQLMIPKYNYQQQLEIVSELDKVQEIINIRKKQMEQLDELIKSQFVEMFGDVINNQKNFEYKRIDEISKIVTGTTPDTNNSKNWNGNIKWITPAEIDKNTFIINDTERKITEEGRKSKSLTIMPKGTVLFTTRAPIGKTAIIGDEMCCNQGFKNCICKKDINNIYLYFVLKYNANYFDCLGTGATFRELSKTNFSKIKISVPPIELQNKFADFVKQIDKQKFEIQKTLEETQKLQESLMNKYFG